MKTPTFFTTEHTEGAEKGSPNRVRLILRWLSLCIAFAISLQPLCAAVPIPLGVDRTTKELSETTIKAASGTTITLLSGSSLIANSGATVDLGGVTLTLPPMFAADAGSTDAYVVTFSPAIAGYVTGQTYRFKANTANTTAATLNINGLGAKTIKKAAGGVTTDLATNDIRAGQWVDVIYDGTNFQMQSLLGNAPSVGAGTGDLVSGNNLSDVANQATARTNLGLAIGTNVQAYDPDLSSWAAITPGAGVGSLLATPSSANLLAMLTDKTGTGLAVFSISPSFTTPALNVATATSINGLHLTTSTGTITITSAKTLSILNTMTLSGTDSATLNITALHPGKRVLVDAANGNDGSGARARLDKPYLTLGAAKSGASSGDVVRVGPGTFDEINLLKAGVDWSFEPGAKLAYTGNDTGAIFDDSDFGASAAIVAEVRGGDFNVAPGLGDALGAIYVTNASSILDLECNTITGTLPDNVSLIAQDDGLLRLHTHKIHAGGLSFGIFWTNGMAHIKADTITGAGWPVWSEVANGATVTGDLHIRADRVECTGNYAALNFNDNNANARVWVTADIITGAYQGIVAGQGSVTNGAKYYITAQKITHVPTDAGSYATITLQSGNLYLEVEKLTNPNRSSDCGINTAGTGTGFLSGHIGVMENVGDCLNMVLWSNTNARARLRIDESIGMATTGGVKCTAGTLHYTGRVDTSANSSTSPIIVSGTGVITLGAGTYLKSEATQKCIKNGDGSPHTVYAEGAFANTAVDSNITIVGSLTTGINIP